MPLLIESVARMTGHRDREALEGAVLGTLGELVRPCVARLYTLVTSPQGARVFERARIDADGTIRWSPPPARIEDLASLDAYPDARDCIAQGRELAAVSRGAGREYIAPIANGHEAVAWARVACGTELSALQQRLLVGLLRIYSNHLAILEYSEHDSLTGLMNRKTFDETFLKMLAAFQRDDSPGIRPGDQRAVPDEHCNHWLAVVDIDHFKRINDRFGHLYGDEVLVLLARLMRSSFRVSDRLYRFGGEEFAILLDRTPQGHVHEVFERLRTAIQEHHFPQVGEVTVSVGFTRIGAGDSPSGAFDRADEALYFAKQNGRNRVCGFESLKAGDLLQAKQVNADVELF